MKYTIEVSEKIAKKISKIPQIDRKRIIKAIDALAGNPRPDGCKKLKGCNNPPIYRLRSGNYRIAYSIKDSNLVILIIEVAHRKDIYKNI